MVGLVLLFIFKSLQYFVSFVSASMLSTPVSAPIKIAAASQISIPTSSADSRSNFGQYIFVLFLNIKLTSTCRDLFVTSCGSSPLCSRSAIASCLHPTISKQIGNILLAIFLSLSESIYNQIRL